MWQNGMYIVDHFSLLKKEKLDLETSKQLDKFAKDMAALRKKIAEKDWSKNNCKR